MKLSKLNFELDYNSYKQDLIKDFYIKSLSAAKYYDRVSAYFDSRILALYSTGIENIYNNGGQIRFIFSQQISEHDYKLMMEGYIKRSNEILYDNFKRIKLTNVEKNRISNLSFLIQKGIVDIKIAFTKAGILHDKFGLIYDDKDSLYFRGSNNETIAAIEQNHESFEVSCSWYKERLENEKINNAHQNFEKIWFNQMDGITVVDIPNIIKDEIAIYSNGKLIPEADIFFYNSIIADINSSNQLIVRNRLNDFYDFNKDYDYDRHIKRYVVEYSSDKVFYFRENTNYITIKHIIEHWLESSIRNKYNFIVSEKLRDYLKFKDIEIEKLKELGKAIKQRKSQQLSSNLKINILNEFNKFSNIVNNEMSRNLYESQMWEAFFITKMKKSANFSVPGAGKTSIVYGSFAYLNSNTIKQINKLIVIGPKNSFKAWKDEFKKCFGIKKTCRIFNIQDSKFHVNKRQAFLHLRFDSENDNLILINYEQLPSLVDVLKEIIDTNTMLVFDEVHKIKAINGKRAQAALGICKNSKYTTVLTGTPIPNSYLDLFNQLNILFSEEYSTFFRFSTNSLKEPNSVMTEQINQAIYPFFVRTTKAQLDIPMPNEDEKIITYATSKEEQLLSLIRRKFSYNALILYIRLLQAATNPKLILNELTDDDLSSILYSEEDDNDEEDKTIKIKNIFQKYSKEDISLINNFDMTTKFWNGINLIKKLVLEGKQVLVWAIFVNTIDRIKQELKKIGIISEVVYGQTPLETREQFIENFKDRKINVLVTNPHTLGESVSLHETCHDAVYFEYSFNLTHMLQSRDRINRLGLSANQYTQYYYLFLCSSIPEEDSIDLKTYARLKEKEIIMLKSIEQERLESINFYVIDDLIKILSMN